MKIVKCRTQTGHRMRPGTYLFSKKKPHSTPNSLARIKSLPNFPKPRRFPTRDPDETRCFVHLGGWTISIPTSDSFITALFPISAGLTYLLRISFIFLV